MKSPLANLLSLFLLFGLAAMGQVDKGAVTGTLTDPSGATVAGATVTISYPSTGLKRSVATNGSGVFLIVGLPVGHVVVDAVKGGFRPLRTEIDVNVRFGAP